MNWKRITAYAATLFSAQFAVGFFVGTLAPVGLSTALVSCFVSFIVCGSIFAHLSAKHLHKPFAHAWVALALQIVSAVALSQALSGWLGDTPMASVVLEWLVLIFALLIGTAVGLFIRRSNGQPADA